jgi:hypothetical protein
MPADVRSHQATTSHGFAASWPTRPRLAPCGDAADASEKGKSPTPTPPTSSVGDYVRFAWPGRLRERSGWLDSPLHAVTPGSPVSASMNTCRLCAACQWRACRAQAVQNCQFGTGPAATVTMTTGPNPCGKETADPMRSGRRRAASAAAVRVRGHDQPAGRAHGQPAQSAGQVVVVNVRRLAGGR